MPLKTAILLCGGQSLRLRPLTDDKPKAMIEVGGAPIIDHQLAWLRKNGIQDVILACGYKWEKLRDHLGDSVKYSVETQPLGTLGAARQALTHADPAATQFIVINGDNVSDVDLNKLWQQGPESLTLTQFRCPYGVWKEGGGFDEKPLLPYWINAGIYCLSRTAIQTPGKMFETEVFPKIAIKPYRHNGFWMTVDTVKDLESAEKFLKTQ